MQINFTTGTLSGKGLLRMHKLLNSEQVAVTLTFVPSNSVAIEEKTLVLTLQEYQKTFNPKRKEHELFAFTTTDRQTWHCSYEGLAVCLESTSNQKLNHLAGSVGFFVNGGATGRFSFVSCYPQKTAFYPVAKSWDGDENFAYVKSTNSNYMFTAMQTMYPLQVDADYLEKAFYDWKVDTLNGPSYIDITTAGNRFVRIENHGFSMIVSLLGGQEKNEPYRLRKEIMAIEVNRNDGKQLANAVNAALWYALNL